MYKIQRFFFPSFDFSSCVDTSQAGSNVLFCFDFYQAPNPVALFPLNSTFGTKEIKNRVAQGVPTGVTLAPGPNGEADGSYEFSGTNNSYIEIPNSAGGPLDVRHSITMLCWVYHNGQDGPLFNYKTDGPWGVHLWVVAGKLFVRFTKRDYSFTTALQHTALAGGWKFVGASYDRGTGNAKLWVNGAVVQTLNIGIGLDLATQDSIRMGAKIGDERHFKGRIAQMQVYNEALTQEQIQAIQKKTRVVGEYLTVKKKKGKFPRKHACFGDQINYFVIKLVCKISQNFIK